MPLILCPLPAMVDFHAGCTDGTAPRVTLFSESGQSATPEERSRKRRCSQLRTSAKITQASTMSTATAMAVRWVYWCRTGRPYLLNEVESLGVNPFAGYVKGAEGVLHRVLHRAGATDEVLQHLIIGG